MRTELFHVLLNLELYRDQGWSWYWSFEGGVVLIRYQRRRLITNCRWEGCCVCWWPGFSADYAFIYWKFHWSHINTDLIHPVVCATDHSKAVILVQLLLRGCVLFIPGRFMLSHTIALFTHINSVLFRIGIILLLGKRVLVIHACICRVMKPVVVRYMLNTFYPLSLIK